MNTISESGAAPPFAQKPGQGSLSGLTPLLVHQNFCKPGLLFWTSLSAATAVAAIGLLPVLTTLWEVWTTDPLRSIGILITPLALFLIWREWRLSGWELNGTWWGLIPLLFAYLAIAYPRNLLLSSRLGHLGINLLPQALPLCLFGFAIVLLFAGPRVCRNAWFPIALLLLAQPVPGVFLQLLDYPLQNLSAHTARAFATAIGFAPTSQETLRLMFTPNFGMFIAPGCDGIRGAVGLGYAALIIGYLKRVSPGRWALYVCGAVLLGHLFNLIRLCALVVYYRIAVGHPSLEHLAREADYVIGGFLFLVAILLFLTIVFRRADSVNRKPKTPAPGSPAIVAPSPFARVAAVFVVGLFAAIPALNALRIDHRSVVASVHSGRLQPQSLDDLLPKQLGNFKLVRSWQEQSAGVVSLEAAVYRSASSDEITLGIWLRHSRHNAHDSWTTRGDSAEARSLRSFETANGRLLPFDTAFYTDGVSDRLAGTTDCTPVVCRAGSAFEKNLAFDLSTNSDFSPDGSRAVPLFFSIERLHESAGKDDIVRSLSTEAQDFLSGVDFGELSRRFQ